MKKTANIGHLAHSEAADEQRGLSGKMRRPLKIVVIGVGSGFTPRLMNDVLMIPGADRGEIGLVDIDRERLTMVHQIIEKLITLMARPAGASCPRHAAGT